MIGDVKMEAQMAWEEAPMVEGKFFSKEVHRLWLSVLLEPVSSLITTLMMGAVLLSCDALSREPAEWYPWVQFWADLTTRSSPDERMKGTLSLVSASYRL